MLYLFFYQFSFGHKLSEFYDASDILRVSYRDIGIAYLAGIFIFSIMLAIALYRHRQGVYNKRRASKASNAPIYILFVVTPLLAITWSAYYYQGTNEIAVLPFVLIAMPFWAYAMKYSSALHLTIDEELKALLFLFGIYLILAFATSASFSAERDRVERRDKLIETNPTCEDFIVIRSVGNHFLAVSETEDRVLIDEACTERFKLADGPRQSSLGTLFRNSPHWLAKLSAD